VAFVGIEGEDETAVPVWVYVAASFDNTADGSVAIFEGILGGSRERANGFIDSHVGRELAAIDQHFRAGTNGGGVGLDKDLVRGEGRQYFFTDFDVKGFSEKEGLALHGT
jgi:hypothetical protein